MLQEQQTPQVECPVQETIPNFRGNMERLVPAVDFLQENKPLPVADVAFPVGTITSDGRLDMCKQNLGVEGTQTIVNALKKNAVVQHILLGTNGMGNEGAEALAMALRDNNNVQTVYLGCNHIGAEGVQQLCSALEENKSVRSLWLKRNPIGKESAPHIIRLLQKNNTLRTLDLVNTCMEEGFIELLEYLTTNQTIERLYLSGNHLSADMMPHVNTLLESNTTLKALFLSVNPIGDEGIRCLTRGLATNSTLQELSFASCGIAEKGMLKLLSALSGNTNLRYLDLGYAPSTKVLSSTANSISDAATEALVYYLDIAPSLEYLNLSKTGLSENSKQLLQNTVAQRGSLLCVMDGYRAGTMPQQHPDSKAIKSVYR